MDVLKKCRLLLVIFASLCFLGAVAVAEAAAEGIYAPEDGVMTHCQDNFDRVGTIYSVDDNGIVIDDMYIPFASDVRYMTLQSDYSSLRYFKPGQKVGYILNKNHQIKKLCLFMRAREES